MANAQPIAEVSKGRRITARIMSGIAVAFLLFDSVIHIAVIQPVAESFQQLGYPVHVAAILGAIELVLIVLYLVPRTAVFGAILLTGYLGGAISAQVRVEAPLFTHVLFPVYIAVLLWGGRYLVDGPLRALLPIRQRNWNEAAH